MKSWNANLTIPSRTANNARESENPERRG